MLVLLLLGLVMRVEAQDATPEPTQTPYPTSTPSPTPIATLPRNPTAEQLYSYLLYHQVGRQTTEQDNPRPFLRWIFEAQFLYHDLNGDTQDDLVVFNDTNIAVMVWTGNEYGAPLVQNNVAGRIPGARVLFEDWTGDAVPELIYDYRDPYVGTNMGGSRWVRSVIHCGAETCTLAWEGYMEDNQFFGPYTRISYSEIRLGGDGTFVYQTDGFYISAVGLQTSEAETRITQFATIQAEYEWTGTIFARLTETITTPAQAFTETTNLEAIHNDQTAQIFVEIIEANEPQELYNRVFCQLLINEQPIDDVFPCAEQYTSVTWRDVTNDDLPELIVDAITPFSEINSVERNCEQRRIMIYQMHDDDIGKIADVAGCLVSRNLTGVQLQDIDGDEQIEIIANRSLYRYTPETGCNITIQAPIIEGVATCFWQLNDEVDVYIWDGEQFVLDET